MCIGYELKLAPLQTLAFYNAIANNGVKVQPMIVKEIKQNGQVLEHYEPKVLIPRICSDETVTKLRAMLEGVVLEGTARAIRTPDYSIAGKTGTAWKFKNGQYTKMYSTSFCGYFPANKPKYSCIVVVDSPKRGNWSGAQVAAPIFREVADKAMARDAASQRPLLARAPVNKTHVPKVQAGVQDELMEVCQQLGVSTHSRAEGDDWVRAASDSQARSLTLQPAAVRPGRVPDVQGLTLRDALFLLENRGLRVRALGSGRVQRQSIAAGSPVRRGSVIMLELTPIGATPTIIRPVAPPTEDPNHVADNKPTTPPAVGAAAKTEVKAATKPKPSKQLTLQGSVPKAKA
jgi:cell division protein FtsI (penicillin-binding protein 3)